MKNQTIRQAAKPINGRNRGMALSLSSQILWGLAGNVGEYLFTATTITVGWLVGFRLITAGLILLTFLGVTRGWHALTAIWHDWRSATVLVLFSIFAMLGIQLTYFTTISYSNAATATVLQFTSPVLVIGFLAIAHRQWPSRIDLVTVLGTFLLITGGDVHTLSISVLALIWGLLTAASDAVYILLPKKSWPVTAQHRWSRGPS
ncbi:DMT family transporter [Lactiplantibacillus carotarum]|uniref:DMT family transporter n=1 Tax=Lactiplantibacillus carotarum TaxID=2993456 RepID=UPI00298EE667|nr:DMT family transporter [Lactiplantibacillus carotarum]